MLYVKHLGENNVRLNQLDSLRGLAAFTVMIGHFLVIFKIMEARTYTSDVDLLYLFKYSPLHIFWAAHEAVIFFFLLSGFVLSLPFYRGRVHYGSFLVKRICRIYIPYFFLMVLSVFLKDLFYSGHISALGNTFNNEWKTPYTQENLIQHFLLLGNFDSHAYNSVIWSLVHEMRISIIFPFVMFFIVKFNWKYSVGLAVGLSFLYTKLSNIYPMTYTTDYIYSIHYLSFFIIGAVLAKQRMEIIAFFSGRFKVLKVLLIGIGILFYTYAWWFSPGKENVHTLVFDDWSICIGASIFIILSLSAKFLAKVLSLPPIAFLGKVSYSLYLIHLITLMSAVHFFYGKIPTEFILGGALILSILLSYLSYKFIELPSIKLGKNLSLRITKSSKKDQIQIPA